MDIVGANIHDVVKIEAGPLNEVRGAKECPDHDTRDFIFTTKAGTMFRVTAYGACGGLRIQF